METLPVNLKLSGQPVLLVGGGTVATRKARFLFAAGARVTVIAPDCSSALRELLESHEHAEWHQRRFRQGDVAGFYLVVAATPDSDCNRAVSDEARGQGVPVNVVDDPALCSFLFPAIVDRSPILVSISSGGASPVLARGVRRRVEAQLPARLGELASFARSLRDRVREAIPDEMRRRHFWEEILEGSIAELVLVGRETEARAAVEERLVARDTGTIGEVYLIGAGPGDPDLMTFKALRLLQAADVVLHDRLVAPEIVAMARRDARRIYVGKRRSEHAMPQEDINRALVDFAREGLRVARLKGGDPFVFGRGGEEIALLAAERIPFQIVPGITAANAAACYAGIPLTHRDHAQSVRFVTGHTRDGRLEHPWSEFLSPRETLVFYMGLVGLPIICEQLQAHGRPPDTPIALVEKATTAQQRVITATLATMMDVVARENPEPPTLVIIGDVVKLESSLAWYGDD